MKNPFAAILAIAILPGLFFVQASSSCFAGDAAEQLPEEEATVCPYCKGTGNIEVRCTHCRGTGLGKELCPACKGKDLTKQRCSFCKGKDLTKQRCPFCKGKDLTKKACAICKGTGKDWKGACYACSGTGKQEKCRRCSGTGKKLKCYHCSGTGKRPTCDSCDGTGRKSTCQHCSGTGKKTIDCTHCKKSRISSAPSTVKKSISFFAVSLGDIVVAATVGKTHVANRSDNPVHVDAFEITGRDEKGILIYTQQFDFKAFCPPHSTLWTANGLGSLEAIQDLSVRRGNNTTKMKRYKKAAGTLQEFLKKGRLNN